MRVDKSQLGIVSEFGSFLLSWASLVVFRAQSDQRFATGEYNTTRHYSSCLIADCRRSRVNTLREAFTKPRVR